MGYANTNPSYDWIPVMGTTVGFRWHLGNPVQKSPQRLSENWLARGWGTPTPSPTFRWDLNRSWNLGRLSCFRFCQQLRRQFPLGIDIQLLNFVVQHTLIHRLIPVIQ